MAAPSKTPPVDTGDARYPELADARSAIADLGRARRRLEKAGADYAAAVAPVDHVETAAVEVLCRAHSGVRALRRILLAIKIQYAVLYSRVEDLSEGSDWLSGAVGKSLRAMEPLIELGDEPYDGRSRDGWATAVVDRDMRLVDLDADPALIRDPAYKSSLVEAVNAALRPIYRTFHGPRNDLMTEMPEPKPQPWDDPEDMAALDALWALFYLQEEVAEFLAWASRGWALSELAERAERLARSSRKGETAARREVGPVHRYRSLLKAKLRLPQVTKGDLAGLEELHEMFETAMLDDLSDLVDSPAKRAARKLIEAVKDDLKLRARYQVNLVEWQVHARRFRYRLAAIEEETFEGRASDGSVTARVAGTVHLVDVTLNGDRELEPEQLKAGLIEAINSAVKTVLCRRTWGPPILSPNG